MVKVSGWRGGTGQWITFASRPRDTNLEWLEVLSDEDVPLRFHGTRRYSMDFRDSAMLIFSRRKYIAKFTMIANRNVSATAIR